MVSRCITDIISSIYDTKNSNNKQFSICCCINLNFIYCYHTSLEYMRLKEFDILKGIGILLVLLGHTGISGLLYTFIYAFHMPLFFFASGCFHKQKDSMSFIKKKVKGLLLPYLFFVACFFIMSVFLECMQSHSLSIGILSTISSLNPMNEHCWILYRTIWFLLCLFEISVIYHIIDRLEHLRWSRDNGSAHCDMPQNVVLGRPGGGNSVCSYRFYSQPSVRLSMFLS